MRTFINITRKIADVARAIVMVAIVLIMVLIVADVVLRHTIKVSISGVTEYSQMLMAIIMLAAGSTGICDGHVRVDMVTSHLSQKIQKVLAAITCVFGTLIAAGITVQSVRSAMQAMASHLTYTTLGMVKWPFYMLYAVALGILTLCAIAMVLSNVILVKDIGKEAQHE